MKAKALFREHKSEIVRLWAEEVFNTYPFETTGFLRTREDPFSNPVANMTKEAADALYDAMSGEHVDPAQTKHALERFIKLRAVQKFAPSQGLGVFFLMKPILREHLLPKFMALGDVAPYMEAESRLDSLTLLAFDMYTEAREVLANLRITEIRTQHAQLARWAQQLEGGSPHPVDER